MGVAVGAVHRSMALLAVVVIIFILPHLGSGESTGDGRRPPAFACDASSGSHNVSAYGFCDGSLALESRVRDLVKRLSLDEKIGLLVNKGTGVARLGIPAYEWWSEALHGVSYVGPGTHFSSLVPGATSFPQVILTAASFNVSLFEAIGKVVSTEARAMYNVGLAGLTYWSPNVNVFRDPRWGRGQETPGEDPLLASKYAVGYVRGLQRTDDGDSDRLKVAACCKHYTAYDVDNWNGTQRYTFNAKVSKQDLEDTFQPPFKSCVVDGNVASVMCSYNQVNGVPTCADPHLLSEIIRGHWKLNGYIVSDCDSVEVLYSSQHYTKSPEQAAAKSILAGLDLDCGNFLGRHAGAALAARLIKKSDVDRAVSHNLATLMRLGFFDGDPRKQPYGELGVKHVCSAEHQDMARDAARQGMVLLKNNAKHGLPFSPKSIKSLAVIGPNANASKTMIGNYEGTPCEYVTPLQGLAAGVAAVDYQPGCENVACGSAEISAAKKAAETADATVLIMGTDQSIERESLDRVDLLLPGQQPKLITEVAKASKGPVVLVIMSGGPFDVTFAKDDSRVSSILWVGFPGEKGGAALADVIFGRHNPGGRSPFTWYPQSFAEKVAMTDMSMRPNKATGYPGRTYRFYTGDVVYAFGDGLSYTEFNHQLLRAPPTQISLACQLTSACRTGRCSSVDTAETTQCGELAFDVHLRVRNAGARPGSHTVFLFSTPPSVHGAPRKHLLGFEKIFLGAGEARTVAFKVDVFKDLSVVDEHGSRKLALGPHLLHVGSLKQSLILSI